MYYPRAHMSETKKVRLREPKREGQEVVFVIAEDSLAPDHPARLLWTALGRFDLSAFTVDAKAVEGHVGRSVTSPRMLLTLWGYSLLEGVVHARQIVRLLARDFVYQWIVGGVSVRRSTLSVFLVSHREALLELLADVVGALMDAKLLFLPEHRLAQDGTKVRADASIASFRTAEGLRECREQAELHLKAVLARLDEPSLSEPEQLARERGAMDVLDRVKAATEAVEEVRATRSEGRNKKQQSTEAKASTTDPECRMMRMADHSMAPGYNLQFATVGDPRGGSLTVVGVRVVAEGNDKGSLMPMRKVITFLSGFTPSEVLADPDHLSLATLRQAAQEGLNVISRMPKRWNPESPDHDAITRAWIRRMASEESRRIYRARLPIAERPNALLKGKLKLRRMPVRGLERVECVALMAAVMINLHEHRKFWLN